MIEIYTDGSCIKNNDGGFGVAIYDNGNLINTYSERYKNTTNNRMEISAILWTLKNYGVKNKSSIEWPIIYTDSKYCYNIFTQWMFDWEYSNWVGYDRKPIKNLDLIKEFYNLWIDGYRVKFKWVRGHDKCEGNILADKLATNKY